MAAILKTQLSNKTEIREILREVNIKYKLDSGEDVETLLIYLQCKDGSCDHSDLLQILKNSIMANFVLNYTEIQKKLSIKKVTSVDELFKKAVRKISKHTAQGELGELLLYTLLDVYFNAPKILSKISLKTSRRMPVHGVDAVHAQFVGGKIRIYLGESKLHESFSTAAVAAVESISNIFEKYKQEFDLIDSHLDFPGIDEKQHQEILDLLNPFKQDESILLDSIHTPCFIGFVEQNIFSKDEKAYLEQYCDVARHYISNFYKKLHSKKIEGPSGFSVGSPCHELTG